MTLDVRRMFQVKINIAVHRYIPFQRRGKNTSIKNTTDFYYFSTLERVIYGTFSVKNSSTLPPELISVANYQRSDKNIPKSDNLKLARSQPDLSHTL